VRKFRHNQLVVRIVIIANRTGAAGCIIRDIIIGRTMHHGVVARGDLRGSTDALRERRVMTMQTRRYVRACEQHQYKGAERQQ